MTRLGRKPCCRSRRPWTLYVSFANGSVYECPNCRATVAAHDVRLVLAWTAEVTP